MSNMNAVDDATFVYSGGNLPDLSYEEIEDIRHLIIEDGVTHIPEHAFWEWRNLETVQFSDTVISIGEYAFSECEHGDKSLISIDPLPKSLEIIDDHAFEGCWDLSSVNFPESLHRIGDSAFEECGELLEVIFPQCLTYMGQYAFSGCNLIRKIEIPPLISAIKSGTFSYCENVTKINIPPSVTRVLYESFRCCKALKSLKLPNTLEIIDTSAFFGCDSLESIQIPPSTTLVGDNAFSYCTSLKIIYAPSTAIKQTKRIFLESNENIIILSDTEGFEYESHPTISIRGIQHCLNDLPDDIPITQQLHSLHAALKKRYPNIAQRAEPVVEQRVETSRLNLLYQLVYIFGYVRQTLLGLFLNTFQQAVSQRAISQVFNPHTITQQAKISTLTLLHLLVYFPGDIYEPLSDLLNKCPIAASAVDDTGKTPLHHAIISTNHNMDRRCYDLLLQRSPNKVVHAAIRSKSPWYDVIELVKAKINGLRETDEESGLLPFMMTADAGYDLTDVYELLCLQPDVLKIYV